MTYTNKFQPPRGSDPQLAEAIRREFMAIESALKWTGTGVGNINEAASITKTVSTAGTVNVSIPIPLGDTNYSVVPIMYCSDGTITVERFVPSSRTKNSFQVVCATTGVLHCLLSRSAQTPQVNKT